MSIVNILLGKLPSPVRELLNYVYWAVFGALLFYGAYLGGGLAENLNAYLKEIYSIENISKTTPI